MYGHAQHLMSLPLARLGKAETEIEQLKAKTSPVLHKPGTRVDAQGREWYSAAWL